ncbi:4-hydroxythreonine-4-phosphate dehydrogenase PdxA [Persicirhabdus sediminis]|uniref:4-hydroxythreonine-4-phosphate dehydrogenase PdxA n=1 Tax=Persicirhabdus sediminis TaxID=454144 RepID=A0A8J7MGL6_9BACT|nr:4-hydroxythreonine-4-phosphate dehydrogenase PdxA [Persicirhabdus sediminis]MBK1791449.1 4-hydroxythreonine-4-phosphate dehydrogenase PdxA [Persicirhabdus sediminis]
MKTIGITLGDQAGIGPEIIEAALKSGRLPADCEYRIIGPKLDNVIPGKPTIETAQAALDGLEEAASLLKFGEIDGVVTGPIAKDALHDLGFSFPGQTEFFATRLDVSNYAMCLSGKSLTVGLVTTHIAISDVSSHLNRDEITRIGNLLVDFCFKRGITSPAIAVCGLNPHCGENGAFGDEDQRIIQPAINQLNFEYMPTDHTSSLLPPFSGPHAADTIFRPAVDGDYDAVLCMYHDQGLIPLKLLDFDTGVNITLGLPRPRTSPDHGTAFALAGKGKASAESMIHAIQMCVQLA